MSTEPLDPAQIMAEHEPDGWADDDKGWCRKCGRFVGREDRCLTYRLAKALTAKQRQVTHSRAQIMAADQALAAERARVQRVEAGPIAEIADQRARNHAKWGERSIENRQPDYAGWLPTLGEEFGEVCRAQTLEDASTERLRSELIDTAAVALMWIDSIDRATLAADTEPSTQAATS